MAERACAGGPRTGRRVRAHVADRAAGAVGSGYRPGAGGCSVGGPVSVHLGEATLDTVPALVARTGYTGEDGVEILTSVSSAPQLWRAILSFAEVSPVGLGARDTLRLEMGYPLYGSDMDRTVDPISAGLGWVVPHPRRATSVPRRSQRSARPGPRPSWSV